MLGEAAGGGDEPTFVVNHGVSPEIRQKLRFGIRTRVTENTLVYRIMVHVRLFNFEKLPPYTSLFDTCTVINFLVLILITIDFIHVCKEY